MKTYVAKLENVSHGWYIVDASGKILGRLASEIAKYLRGKNKPEYTPHIDTGDYIVVINAKYLRLSGNKAYKKIYYYHTGYPGGIKETHYDKMSETHPERVIEFAVRGMLPKNSLGRAMLKKLKVYAGNKHPHDAQQPKLLEY